jgi:hypothetical protein
VQLSQDIATEPLPISSAGNADSRAATACRNALRWPTWSGFAAAMTASSRCVCLVVVWRHCMKTRI